MKQLTGSYTSFGTVASTFADEVDEVAEMFVEKLKVVECILSKNVIL